MKITKVTGHNKKGKKIDMFYGSFKVKGAKIVEIIMTNNYVSEKRAISETKKKMSLYENIIN